MKNLPADSPLSPPPRREFLRTTALAGAAAGFVHLDGSVWVLDGAAPDHDPPPAPSWISRPMRWAQLALVEDDPPKLDVRASQPFPNPPVTLIPSYPDLPMEKVFVRQPRTDVPQVLLRETDL